MLKHTYNLTQVGQVEGTRRYTDRRSSEVPQAMPFPLTPFYPVSPKASFTDRKCEPFCSTLFTFLQLVRCT